MAVVAYWAFIGTFYLLLLTWQDYRNNMRVDDRRNWFMLGLTVSLIGALGVGWWYLLALLCLVIALQYWGRKQKAFGEADINTFSWVFLGFGIIDPVLLLYYGVLLGVLIGLYHVLKLYVFKYRKPTPFYGVILLSYVLMGLWWGLYV